MKKLVKKISNSFLLDWKGMNTVRKVLFVAMMTSSLALITSKVFFHQFLDFLFVVTLSVLTIYLLYMVGGVFVAIFKEMIKTFPEEWRKMKKIEKILFVGFLTGSVIILPAVFFKLKVVAFSALVLMSADIVFYIIDYLFSGSRLIDKITPQLADLEKEIADIDAMENKVEAIVKLFQVISPIEDKGGFSQIILKLQKKNYGQLTDTISTLKELNSYFTNTRDVCGLNRTKQGEEVTAEKIFLGDLFGIWTLNASYWLNNQEKCRQELRPDVSKYPKNPVSTWYLINDYQAGPIVKRKTEGILKQITLLKKVA